MTTRRRHGRRPWSPADHLSKWYGQVIGLNDVTVARAAGHHRPARPERRRQVHVHEADHRASSSRARASITVLGEPIWGNPALYLPHRLLPGAGRVLRPDDRPRVGDRARPPERPRRSEAADAARRALETVDLIDAADKKIGAYSKGMRQRVKLAQAIVHDPELLILDEPLAGMDPLAPPQDDPPDPGLGARRQEHHRLEPHPARDRVDDVEHPADQQRPDPRRGQRPPDPRPHRRASAHRVHPRPQTRARWRAGSWPTTTC